MYRISSFLPLIVLALCCAFFSTSFALDEDTPRIDDLEAGQDQIYVVLEKFGNRIKTAELGIKFLNNYTTDLGLRLREVQDVVVALQAKDTAHDAALATAAAQAAAIQADIAALQAFQAWVESLLGPG